MEPPGGIADDDVAVTGDPGLNGIEDHRRGIGALFVLDDVHPRALGPDVQLVDGSRPEGIRRAEDHLFALGLIHGSHFADGGGFARAVDADDKDHRRNGDEPHILAAVEQVGDDALQLLFHLGRLFDLFALYAVFELLHHLHGGGDANVPHDEDLLQLHVKIVLEGIEGIEHIVDGARHFVPGL